MQVIKRILTRAAQVLLAFQVVLLLGLCSWFLYEKGVNGVTRGQFLDQVFFHQFPDGHIAKNLNAMRQARNERVMWKIGHLKNDPRSVWGYVDRHSVLPGELISIMLGTSESKKAIHGQIRIYRVGYYPGEDRKQVWASQTVAVRPQSLNNSMAYLGGNWPIATKIQVLDDWRAGYYTVDFVGADDSRHPAVAFFVVKNPEMSGDILVKLSTNTYQAYNRWGGHSLYRSPILAGDGSMVSFDRPTQQSFFKWEYYYVIWLEKFAQEKNLRVDYATDFDVHQDRRFTVLPQIFISLGHDEYWTKEEYDHIYHRIFKLGKNTLFLGANIAYWQVRYVDVHKTPEAPFLGRQMICYKSRQDPIANRTDSDPTLLWTAQFRDGARRPETMLMGVAYQSNWFGGDSHTRVPYFVADINFPFFKGTGYKVGDSVGDLVGYEWDNRDPLGDGQRLWNPETSRIPKLPEDRLRVVLAGDAVDKEGNPGLAEAVYFESPAGAKVFSAGTVRWSWGLSKESFESESFRMLNANLISYFLK